jgi:hypothetical protein
MVRIVGGKIGRAAIQHDACAHPVGAHARIGRVAQGGGTVAQAALAGQVFGGGVERGHLVRNAARPVGIAEMGHERDLVHLRQRVQTRPGSAIALRREPQAVHARVQLEEHAVRHLRLVGRQHVDLLVAVHGMPQRQARAQLQVARLEHALQQQDGAAPAQVAHALGLCQVKQRKTIGGAQALKGPLDAVAVGVGLDYRPGFGIGHGLAHAREVVVQGIGVDGGVNRARHGDIRRNKHGILALHARGCVI